MDENEEVCNQPRIRTFHQYKIPFILKTWQEQKNSLTVLKIAVLLLLFQTAVCSAGKLGINYINKLLKLHNFINLFLQNLRLYKLHFNVLQEQS